MANVATSVELGLITTVTGDMYQAIEDLRLSVRAVDDASDTVRAGWKGTGNDSFTRASEEWSIESDELNKTLDALTQTVEKATESIVGMDEDGFIPGGGYESPAKYTSL
ncbi:WXG100 family type VII secretion target [Nocardia sp. CA-290969]|uniref:WXG100 family type VII secretion target n=1 Tax=Nocardia sp. CA-290969 TaxID=3239986 RepID=UPI003D8B80A1